MLAPRRSSSSAAALTVGVVTAIVPLALVIAAEPAPVEAVVADGLRWLSDHGVPVDRADLDGMTPLHLAALHYSTNAAKQLLDLGAAVDPRDKYGNTPLFKAVFESCGRGDMVRLLKANGADVNAVNLHGVTPKSLAYTIANFNVRQFFDE
jgi:ankyrin repeat protein